MVADGLMSKAERRRITKQASKPVKILTERQKLRLEVKAKKALPKLTRDERRQKYLELELINDREKEQERYSICLGCRQRGHVLKNCPNKNVVKYDARNEICFNCGSKDHALRACPLPKKMGHLPFANCFICKNNGHIARDCPENPNGLYPNGGCCHICLQKTHLVRDCPERTEEDKEYARRKRQELEDQQKGIRMKGLTTNDMAHGDALGDDVEIENDKQRHEYDDDDENNDDDNDDDDDSESNKKRKKKKSSKSSKSKKSKK